MDSLSLGFRVTKTSARYGRSILSIILSIFLAASILYLAVAGSLAVSSSSAPFIRPLPFVQALASAPPTFQATWDDLTSMFDYSDANFDDYTSQVFPSSRLHFLHNAASVIAFIPALLTYPFDYFSWFIEANKVSVSPFPFELASDLDQLYVWRIDSDVFYVKLRPVILLDQSYDVADFPLGTSGAGTFSDPFIGYVFFSKSVWPSEDSPSVVGNSLVLFKRPGASVSAYPLAMFEYIYG